MLSAPFVTLTLPGAHRLKALTGLADQERQDSQWQ